jgi:hypothetical protein
MAGSRGAKRVRFYIMAADNTDSGNKLPITAGGKLATMLDEEDDYDRDSLNILPLSIFPFENESLRHARLIMNAHLESVVEVFHDKQSGSGQLDVGEAEKEFGPMSGGSRTDMMVLRALGSLHSYDVFSLRYSLRELGIEVNDLEALKLSDQRVKQLTSYMKDFTHPLIQEIYGNEDVDIQNFGDVIALFKNPDMGEARKKLRIMADKLGVDLADLPKFLEDYGDIFLSLSYYQQCLDEIRPTIKDFLRSIEEIQNNPQFLHNINLMKTCRMMHRTVGGLMKALASRFDSFEESTRNMWHNISAEKFREVEAMIESYHTTIGGELCSLSVKMDAWKQHFPNRRTGGPARRADFLMTDIRQGIENIIEIERAGPRPKKTMPKNPKAISEEAPCGANPVDAADGEPKD